MARSAPLLAQVSPPSTGGAVAAEHAQRMLGHNKRVLVIGAHPDDEDTDLITVLVRGEGAVAAYLSLNRGEGGQNLIGPELGEALGLLRTEELLSARSLDGGRQYFTRAYDFGYSKTLEDTWNHWPRDSILKDVVRVIREFQPQVIVSDLQRDPRGRPRPAPGGGLGGARGVRCGGGLGAFPGAGHRDWGSQPWRASKFYRSTRWNTAPKMITIQTGILDAAVGQSYHQIAMASRSRHRSQDMGVLQAPGPAFTRMSLVVDRTGAGDSLWAGIDTLLPTDVGQHPGPAALRDQATFNSVAIANRRGIILDAVANAADLVAGQSAEVTLSLWNAGANATRAATRVSGAMAVALRTPLSVAARGDGDGDGHGATSRPRRAPSPTSSDCRALARCTDGGTPPVLALPASPPLLTATAVLDDEVSHHPRSHLSLGRSGVRRAARPPAGGAVGWASDSTDR